MGEKEPLEDPGVTHSICPECFKYFSSQWSGFHLAEYLDTFEEPMVAFNANARVIAYNKSYAAHFLKTEEKQIGLLGGDFLECSHARLPEGCGQTICCRDCTLRTSITQTLRTGRPQEKVPAYLNTYEDGLPVVKNLWISTEKQGPVVRMTIEERTDP
jgi:hypothetical protein